MDRPPILPDEIARYHMYANDRNWTDDHGQKVKAGETVALVQPDGEWVLYDDYAQAVTELMHEIVALAEQVAELRGAAPDVPQPSAEGDTKPENVPTPRKRTYTTCQRKG